MDAQALSQLANSILDAVGLGPATGLFTPEVAWQAHRRANARTSATTILRKLLDIEEHHGSGSTEEAIVQTVVNCGPVPLEQYSVAIEVWQQLGYEIYENGDGSHGAHIPMWVRETPDVAH